MRPKSLKEKQIRQQVISYIKMKGYFWWYNLQGLGCFLGLPDIFLLCKGQLLGIEFKTEKGMQSDMQKNFEQLFGEHGGLYYVVRKLEDFLEIEKIFNYKIWRKSSISKSTS